MVGLARLQKLTTGSRSPSNTRTSPHNQHQRQTFFPFQQQSSLNGSFNNNSTDGSEEGSTSLSLGPKNQSDKPDGQQKFVMSRRRGTAGPMNPKQNVHTDLIVQSKVSGHPSFIKSR